MCGIVCYLGHGDGIARVLEALYLLEYRAPDSSGIAAIDDRGDLKACRAVGTARNLVRAMVADPLYRQPLAPFAFDLPAFFDRQELGVGSISLRDCSQRSGYTIADLYRSDGLAVGFGDIGSPEVVSGEHLPQYLSSRLGTTLQNDTVDTFPDYDNDPVRHAFRLVAAHVASQERLQPLLKRQLDAQLRSRLPRRSYPDWHTAWLDELAHCVPGHAFTLAVNYFQDTFPGLSSSICAGDWGRVGGLTAAVLTQIVVGHGRWAMVGAVTEENAHPLMDRSGTRTICENGSHNASLLLQLRLDQETWWRGRGISSDQPVHTSQNTSEVVTYEWERARYQIEHGDLSPDDRSFVANLVANNSTDPEEQALRLALRRVAPGSTHACALYSQHRPGTLFVSSHNKPVALITRRVPISQDHWLEDMIIASDANAALMLWSGKEVEMAAADRGQQRDQSALGQLNLIPDQFAAEVIYLDTACSDGREIFARISHQIIDGRVQLQSQISKYDGSPLMASVQPLVLNPAMVGRRDYDSFTEQHIAEIPEVMSRIAQTYIRSDQIVMNSVWHEGRLIAPGLNVHRMHERYGADLRKLRRLLLIGEGSSWRDAQAAAPLLRTLLPNLIVTIYRPVEVLNLGESMNPQTDLAIEISWSGTTDSVLKVDSWLAEQDVLRIGITARTQSDLGRFTAHSGGTIDVQSNVEVSVATVKGFQAILMTLHLLSVHLAWLQPQDDPGHLRQLTTELQNEVVAHVAALARDGLRRQRIRDAAKRCAGFNKVAIIGDSPIVVEAELKIEEIGQIVARSFDFESESVRALIERTALRGSDEQRVLFIINATSAESQRLAKPIIDYLRVLGVFCIIHTIDGQNAERWQHFDQFVVFTSPEVSAPVQPLIDAPFYFDLAVALAYARGLTPDEIDRPRNLAKSVTTTAAGRRRDIELRPVFGLTTPESFGHDRDARKTSAHTMGKPTPTALQATMSLRGALAVLTEPLPPLRTWEQPRHLVVYTDTEATENGAKMARAAWQTLLDIDVTVYRRFMGADPPEAPPDTMLLRIIRSGAVLSLRDDTTIALPSDLTPLQWEGLTCVYLTGLAVRFARQRGIDTVAWERVLLEIPLVMAEMLCDLQLSRSITASLSHYVASGYDKLQIIGGGQDYASAHSIARSLCAQGFLAEALYTDSAWHGPLAAVGGKDADHDTLIVILATDPLFQESALVDTQVYRTRHAQVILIVPEGRDNSEVVRGVDASVVLTVPSVPRPFTPLVNMIFGTLLAAEMQRLWQHQA